ncbi:hypothetical protein FSP39_011307 [Pinctada imbricata]|uniref:WW domain-containing protein n=1 Tax=Pinctada imbricata TaxID=66713 RepID=A0AA88YQT0_PINIB|nr:hypothetical protein FSP39_011307 [Pinctada imbricata]
MAELRSRRIISRAYLSPPCETILALEAKYGYSRAEEEDSRDGMDEGNEDEIDQSTQSTPEHLPESTNGLFQDQNPPDIDNKVADFLAEIDALHEDDEEEDARPSFKTEVEIPPPTFQLNPNQQLSKPEEEWERPERVKEVKPATKSSSGKSAYGSMFVKGGSEFVREQTEPSPVKQNTPEVEWPEEPTTVWQQTLDDNTGCNYYWNTVTNEVTWEIPPDFTSYLLKYRDYEETVARLTKEGKVKPAPKQSAEKPKTQPQSAEPMESSSITPQQAEISVSSSTEDKSSKTAKSDKPSKSKSEETVLPDSSNSKGKAPKLVAYFGGSSDESASDSSEDSESSDEEDSKKKEKKKKTKVVEDDESLDIDDIDKALDVALEKKTTEKEKGSRYAKGSKDKKSDREPKSKSLVDALKETIQKKQEVEARRKAAIEEMMARELERRVGPPKRRPTPEEPSLHSNWDSKKVLDYQHGRKRKRSDEYEHSLSRSSREKESRHKHEDRKKHKKDDKDRDRRKEKDDGKKKEKDDHSKKKDKHEEKKRDEKKKHKDKDREERKKDKKKDKERESVEKSDSIEEGKGHSPKKETQEEVKVETESESLKEAAKEEVEEGEVKEEKKPDVDHLKGEDDQEDEETVSQRKAEEKQKAIQLANLKLEASELAELALSKLEFLEVTKKGLSKLQILLIELETRQQDWQAGGLSTEYFLVKLEEANRQLQLYERNAAPPGWSCHWDRRYFYMNKRSGKTQWDYPDDEEEEEEMEGDGKESYPDMEDRNRENSSSVSPPKDNEVDTSISEAKTSRTPSRSTMEELHPTVSSQAVTTHPEPTLSRSKLLHSEHRHKESTYSTDANLVSSSDYGAIVPSDPGPADTTASVVKQTRSEPDELVESSEMHSTALEAEPVSQSTYDYSVATASVLQGQPPPPGTDLEQLL